MVLLKVIDVTLPLAILLMFMMVILSQHSQKVDTLKLIALDSHWYTTSIIN